MASSLTIHSPTGAEAETQTLKQLKINLKDALRKSGVLNSVKAQIRREFIVGLSDKLPSKTVAPANGLDLRERLSLSILYHFLQQRGMTHSLSVFAAECGLDSKLAWLRSAPPLGTAFFGEGGRRASPGFGARTRRSPRVASDRERGRGDPGLGGKWRRRLGRGRASVDRAGRSSSGRRRDFGERGRVSLVV